MIIFDKIRYKNLLSTGNIFTEYNLSKHRTTFLSGKNGSGKSSLLDALTYVLFGKSYRKIKLNQLINSINCKALVVEIEFHIGTTNYKVIRGMKPGIFEIWINDEMIDQESSMKEQQNILEDQILRMNYNTFTQIVIIGSASYVPFMKLPAAARRGIIEDILDIDIFSFMNKLAKERSSVINEEFNEVDHNVEKYLLEYKLNKKHLEESQTDVDNQLKKIDEDINITSKKIDILNDNKQEHINLLDKCSSSEDIITKTTKKAENLSKYMYKIENNISNIRNDISTLWTLDKCSKCDQSISEEYKNEKDIEYKNKLEKLQTGLVEITKEYDVVNEELDVLVNQDKRHNAILNDIKTVDDTIIIYEEQLEKYLSDKTTIQETVNTSVTVEQLNTLEKLIATNIKKLDDIKYNKQPLIQAALTLLKDDGIKTRIIKHYLPVINYHVNKFLDMLSFVVNFQFDENFNEVIQSRYRDDFAYYNFSEGEQARINLALLFTWREISKIKKMASTNLLILDEVFDGSLDTSGTTDFIEILSSIDPRTNSFIISHKQEAASMNFDHYINVIKEGSFSEINLR